MSRINFQRASIILLWRLCKACAISVSTGWTHKFFSRLCMSSFSFYQSSFHICSYQLGYRCSHEQFLFGLHNSRRIDLSPRYSAQSSTRCVCKPILPRESSTSLRSVLQSLTRKTFHFNCQSHCYHRYGSVLSIFKLLVRMLNCSMENQYHSVWNRFDIPSLLHCCHNISNYHTVPIEACCRLFSQLGCLEGLLILGLQMLLLQSYISWSLSSVDFFKL